MSSTIPLLDSLYQSSDALSSDLILIVTAFIAVALGVVAALLKHRK
jgi:hypothetical protein